MAFYLKVCVQTVKRSNIAAPAAMLEYKNKRPHNNVLFVVSATN